MRTVIDVSILVLLLIIAYTSITGLLKLGEVEKKIQLVTQKIGSMAPQEAAAARQEVSANELSSALRAKLSDQQLRELNLKFQ